MKINEVISQDNEDIIEVKNIMMFLKSKGIKEIPIKSIMRELSRRGFDFTIDELEPVIIDTEFVSSVDNGKVSINGKEIDDDIDDEEIETDSDSDEDFDMDEERVKQMARSSRLRRDR